MKKIYLVLLLAVSLIAWVNAQETDNLNTQDESVALLIVDIQEFYFETGRGPLEGSLEASLVAKGILEVFRERGLPVIHVMHYSGGEIHEHVEPLEGEKVIEKRFVNAFRETDLLAHLQEKGIKKLVLMGMMTHMCLEAATRAAADYGFTCTVIHDACATRDIRFAGKTVKARDVHLATLSALTAYGKILSAEEFLEEF
jgi:nicotinamidase-related amidase